MIDRRIFTTLLAGGVAAPSLSPRLSWGQAAKSRTVFYTSVGGEFTVYGMDTEGATLAKSGSETLPANVQYAWPHPSKQYLYIASSGGGPGVASNRNFSSAFRIDPATGALAPHGQPLHLPHRPIHTTASTCGANIYTPPITTRAPSRSTASPGTARWASRSTSRTRSTPANMPI